MSSIAIHIIELVKSLPTADREAVCTALAPFARIPGSPATADQPDLKPEDYEGLEDGDPFFKIMEEIEEQRHAHPGRAAPELD